MAGKMATIAVKVVIVTILLTIPVIFSDDMAPIPADNLEVTNWFKTNVKPYEARKDTLDPALAAAEAKPKVIKVRQDGTGNFKTVTDAVNSIPLGNTRRVIVWIGPGNYTEKITIDQGKPFVTFYGAPYENPTLVFSGTAAQYGTVYSATLSVLSDYFTAINIVIVNSAPRPDGRTDGAQAVAYRIAGDKSAMYNCQLYGFQDTLCDESGRHFFKDCYIEGTLHVVAGNTETMVTAQGKEHNTDDSGYSFVHCTLTGTDKNNVLGRAWRPFATVVFAYSVLGDIVTPPGWSDDNQPQIDNTLFFGEYNNRGPGSNRKGRVKYSKNLSDAEAQPFIRLAYIQASSWLLPYGV
ncbi:hypothetical protein F0562_026428 [Nyssa sinensis]|uniref:pectinesterase n=1 Tax=Nyssa sinensis TaxID=561372 RepID=A0A5J5BBE2_9ASTE|nr:hypothetical protein F0562_026428 [Nyssa sinensis]